VGTAHRPDALSLPAGQAGRSRAAWNLLSPGRLSKKHCRAMKPQTLAVDAQRSLYYYLGGFVSLSTRTEIE
jgi:hypothetical protein